jgi:16S rRNA (guanine527-N7)-methyltransferase
MPPKMQTIYGSGRETAKTDLLVAGLDSMAVDYSTTQLQLLLSYLNMLERWNKAYNLTAVRDPMQMIPLHLLDSLSLLSHIHSSENIIDVGTGPGLPGIPLAIMKPDKSFTLLDSNGKKTRFLFQVISELKLHNVTEVNKRVEQYQPASTFDTVLSRAFSSLPDMLNNCRHLASNDACFMAMKGKNPESELSQLKKDYMVSDMCRLEVPGVVGERHLIKIKITAGSNY